MSRSILDGRRGRGSRSLRRLGLAALVAGGLVVLSPAHLVEGATPPSASLHGGSGHGEAEPSTLVTVRFTPGSSVLPSAIEPTLARIASDLLAAPSVRIALVGYPDRAPDFMESDRSHRLSLTRAIALRSRLVDMGVPRVRMIVRLVALHDQDGRRSNQVDIVKMSGDG